MTENSINMPFTGRANAVFVFGQGDEATSVVSAVVARARAINHAESLRFRGPCIFEENVTQQIVETILPIANRIFKTLGLPEKSFELSIVNLGAASIMDVGLSISGFSANLPIILAFLSAGMKIAVPDDIVSTGHIASPDGDIRMGKGIPAKVAAAVKIGAIRTFVHPALDQDNSLDFLTPAEKAIVSDAITKARLDIETISVSNINELVRIVFPEESVVLASLRQSFCNQSFSKNFTDTPIGKAAEFFGMGIYQRFWKALERQMLSGESNKAKELISALTSYQISQKSYPKGFGEGLANIVHSLPPETFRLKIDFPLIPISQLTALGQFAEESDHEDLRLLFSAAFREKLKLNENLIGNDISSEIGDDDRFGDQLHSIFSEIDADALTVRFGIPIDSARAAYPLESVQVKDFEEFAGIVASYYIHLLRHTQKANKWVPVRTAEAEAFSLIERTFSTKGGFKGALAEARHATNGGLRIILDMITEQFKHDVQEKHINYVMKSALDPLDWENKVALISGIMKRLQHVLPQKTRSQPPERFAGHYELIVNAYVESINKLNMLFRRL